MALQLPQYLTSYTGPHSQSQSSSSATYDYTGLDQNLKRQEEVGALRDAKFAANYNGDIAGAVGAGNRIRDLLTTMRAYTPNATERNPVQMVNPLVRVSSTRSESGSSGSDGSWHGANGQPFPLPPVHAMAGGANPVGAPPPKRKSQPPFDHGILNDQYSRTGY